MKSGSLKHPGRWIWLLLLIPIVLGLQRLRLDVEIFNLLPQDLPAVQGLRIHQEHFANARELIIAVEATEPESAGDAAQTIAQGLKEQPNLVRSVTWQPPWLEHPAQAAELIAYLWFNSAGSPIQNLTNRLAPSKLDAQLALAKSRLATSLSPDDVGRLSYDPFGLTQLPDWIAGAAPSFTGGFEGFSSEDGTFRILFVQAEPELRTYEDCQRWLTAVQRVVNRRTTAGPLVTVSYTGRPAFVAEIAGRMQSDITYTAGGTAVIIAVLFWVAHRRVKPMLWLLTLLGLVLGSTLALGGLIFGALNVLSLGFAAILLGLAVDYAVVHYQEALANPQLTVPQIRHAIAPSILWAALTTIAAFLSLTLGGLPGLAQLGTLVAIGVTLAALIMIFEFLPPLFPERNQNTTDHTPPIPERWHTQPGTATNWRGDISPQVGTFRRNVPQTEREAPGPYESGKASRLRPLAFSLLPALLVCAVLLFKGFPRIDPTAAPLRIRNSMAFDTLARVQQVLSQTREPLWLLVEGNSAGQVADRLRQIRPALQNAKEQHQIADYTVPDALWPDPKAQAGNRPAVRWLASQGPALRDAAQAAGFAPNALALTENILNAWQAMALSDLPFWPTNDVSHWVFEKFAARTPTNFFVLGLITPSIGPSAKAFLSKLEQSLPTHSVRLSGWELLGDAIFERVKTRFWLILVPMVLLVLVSLWAAFKRLREVLLSLTVLTASFLCLLCVMDLLGWQWNLLNLMAVPLILGTGVDYSIFNILALRRYNGDLRLAHQSVGRALLLCGSTAVVGFGALSFSSNAGMASLGAVAAVGILGNMLIAIYLLPAWWRMVTRIPLTMALPLPFGKGGGRGEGSRAAVYSAVRSINKPSSLYGPRLWRMGLWLGQVMPRRLLLALSRPIVALYWLAAPARREVTIRNLLPALRGNRVHARKTARLLYRNFATKLIDLWRYEAGVPIDAVLGEPQGWEHILKAREQKRGVLLLIPHLGNWEFGAPFLARKGLDLQVLTLAEPGEGFTELRQQGRARWGVKTLVVREDPFAFLEVIKRLEAGAIVALLMDRPPAPSAVEVTLFGHSFLASIAAAELARASGCMLLPGFVPLVAGRYKAMLLPPVPYDRAALRDRAARLQLTQEIISCMEPVIREYLDQWYHFVPLWSELPLLPKENERSTMPLHDE